MDRQSIHHSFLPEDEAIEVKAFVSLYNVSPPRLKETERFGCLSLDGGCAISLPSAPAIGLNRVLGLRHIDDLEKACSWMQGKTGNRFLQINLNAASVEIKDWMEAKGLAEHGPGWAKLVLDGAYNPEWDRSVPTRLVQPEEAGLFGSMMCEGFNFPPTLAALWASIVGAEGWSCFFALDGEVPVGTGAMYVSGEYAWLGGGTTTPGFRNRGVQKALIRSRVKYGHTHGVSTFAVETEVPTDDKPNISHENLRKLGFRHMFDRKNFKL